MSKQANTPLLLALSLAFCTAGMGQTAYPASERVKKVVDSTYTALIKKHKVVGASLAIIDNGQIVYASGYGFSDKAKQTKATEKTIYRIGSCTKSFTALSILQLQEKGLLDVNASVKTYLTDLTIRSRFNDNNQIYISDMLCHVSGLPCDVMNGFFCDAPPDMKWLIAELNRQTTMSPRRYKHAYSNVAYGLLGEVIARTGKTTYSNYVRDNVFVPLGMRSSYIERDEALAAGFSKGYVNGREISEPLIRDQAAGLIHSNVLDMAAYVSMCLGRGTYNGQKVLSEQSIMEMEKNQLANTTLSSRENWGYGLYTKSVTVKKDKDSTIARIIGHGGDTYAYHSDMAYMPELGVGVIILTNTDNGSSINSANNLLKLYMKQAYGKTINLKYAPKELAEPNPAEKDCPRAEIAGVYNFGMFTMSAKKLSKMSFRQGPAKIVLKEKDTLPGHYVPKAIVYGVMPVKIKNQELSFVKIDSSVYLKALSTKTRRYDYLTVKSKPAPQAMAAWKPLLGSYKAIGTIYACESCPIGNYEGLKMKLTEEKGLIKMDTKAKSSDTKDTAYLEAVDGKTAVIGGIGRGTGYVLRILDNGHLYYQGFEFERVK